VAALLFFGTALMSLVGLILIFATDHPTDLLLVAAFLIYLIGGIGVTGVRNVPWNDRLAAVDADASDHHGIWRDYLTTWTRWNHIRTLACAVTATLLTLSFLS